MTNLPITARSRRACPPRFPARLGLIVTVMLAAGLLIAQSASAQTGALTAAGGRSLAIVDGPDGYSVRGSEPGDQAGKSLSAAGDVNGDGLEDFILGAGAAGPGGRESAGTAYLIYGRTDAPVALDLSKLDATRGVKLVGAISGDRAGEALSGAGDVNGDGYDDIIIGAPGFDAGDVSDVGAVYVVFGRPGLPGTINLAGLGAGTGMRIEGAAEGFHTGASVGGGGDLNGDGYDDILIGAPEAISAGKADAGLSYVIFGGKKPAAVVALSSLTGKDGFRLSGVEADSHSGNAVAVAGDVNRDGFDDALVGAWKASKGAKAEVGIVYLVYGKAKFSGDLSLAGVKGAAGFRLEGANEGDRAGRSAAAAGDINGDGFDDVIIGAPFASGGAGDAYIVFGKGSFADVVSLGALNGADGVRLAGEDANGQAGAAVAGAGDLNGDALDDVIIGAPGAGADTMRFAGEAYLVFGKTSFGTTVGLGSLNGATGLQYDGVMSGDQAGQSVAGAGDTNGDGYDEALIGAPKEGVLGANDLGFSYLIYGGPPLAIALPVTHPGSPNNDNLSGGPGNDVMIGGRGSDMLDGQAGNDVMKGGAGGDTLLGRAGAERLRGGRGRDTASYAGSTAGVTVNLLTGMGSGGDAAGDILRGVEAAIGSGLGDALTGDARDNVLAGGAGNDTLTGGARDDTFVASPNGGQDTVTDFVPGAGTVDRLDLGPLPDVEGLADLNLSQQGANTLITLPDGGTITLLNVQKVALHADDFRFGSAPIAFEDQYITAEGKTLDIPAPGVLANDDTSAGKPVTAVLVSSVSHGTLTLRASGSFTYVPAAGYSGPDQFIYRANNGADSNTATVWLTVSPGAPVAMADRYRATAGETLTIKAPGVLGNDTGSGLSAVLVSPPVNGDLTLNADGSFTYVSTVDFNVTDSFVYRATNGAESSEAKVTIEVLAGSFDYQALLPAVVRP